jgi:Tfp pilus assembly protein PilN
MAKTTMDYRKLFAFGSGVGVEVREADLEVVVARVRPSGADVAGRTTIRKFRERPAADWGAEYLAFLKSLGEGRLSATVLLPRSEVIVRHIALPGVAAKDRDAAVGYQMDTLHPFGEEEAVAGWSPLAGDAVLIGILRRAVLDRYVELFAEAGVPVGSFTFSAAAIHAALRLFGAPPAAGFVAVSAAAAGAGPVEIYGESPAKPLFSAELDAPAARAVTIGISELRLPQDTPAVAFEEVLPKPRRMANPDQPLDPFVYAAALAGACPRLAPAANLLPPELRHSNSRAMFVPTAVLAGALVLCGVAALGYNRIADRSYLRKLEGEIAKLEPVALRSDSLDRQTDRARARARLLDEFHGRTRNDLDALNELTRLMPPPIWTSSIDLTRDAANINGEAEEAAGLIKVIDASPFFQNSEFSVISRTAKNELFRIRTSREARK